MNVTNEWPLDALQRCTSTTRRVRTRSAHCRRHVARHLEHGHLSRVAQNHVCQLIRVAQVRVAWRIALAPELSASSRSALPELSASSRSALPELSASSRSALPELSAGTRSALGALPAHPARQQVHVATNGHYREHVPRHAQVELVLLVPQAPGRVPSAKLRPVEGADHVEDRSQECRVVHAELPATHPS